MPKLIDLTGKVFGRLTVIERAGSDKHKNATWKCRCDCNKEVIVRSDYLRKNEVKSCGCLKKEGLHHTHGMKHTKIYENWCAMKARCLNVNNVHYQIYGGRGIKIVDDFLDFQKFYDYVSTLPHFNEEGYTLDRIDVNGNYEVGNLRFADKKTQTRNRRTTVKVEYKGEKISLAEAKNFSDRLKASY